MLLRIVSEMLVVLLVAYCVGSGEFYRLNVSDLLLVAFTVGFGVRWCYRLNTICWMASASPYDICAL